MISLIIPIYNKSNYIIKCLDSVVNQTFKDFEIIIINDGSTDNSLDIVEKYDFQNIDSKIINQINSGVSIARNNGVRLAKYDYVSFLDADDWWEPTFLEEMVLLIQKYPNAGLWSSDYNIIKNNKVINPNKDFNDDFLDGEINYFKEYSKSLRMPICTISIILCKEIFNEMGGFNQKLKLGEDFDLWIKISIKYSVVFLNKPLSNYNQDVDIENRAIGLKFYKPEEHFLFQNYETLNENSDFIYLFERLALYGLFPYYLYNKNFIEVKKIINTVRWSMHSYEWYIKYNFVPKFILRMWLSFKLFVVKIKKTIL